MTIPAQHHRDLQMPWVRWIALLVVLVVIIGYLSYLISFWGEGLAVGDEGFWLTSQRDAFNRLPRIPATLTPLTDILGSAWIAATAHLGLYGARLGWVAVNAFGATMVYLSLSRWFPVSRVVVALLAATPVICHQQFTVLEYTNIPWFFLLSSGLLFQRCQEDGTGERRAIAGSIVAGILLGMALLSRLIMVPAVAIPVAMWFVGNRSDRATRGAIACSVAAGITTLAGLGGMWFDGTIDELISSFQSTRAMNVTAGRAALPSHSFFGLLLRYVVNLFIGVEQLSLVCMAYALWIAARTWMSRVAGDRFLHLSWLPLAAAIPCAIAAAVAADGMFNLRFQSGMPFMAATFCGVVCLRPPALKSQARRDTVRQLCMLAFLEPIAVMLGSDLGFYRMISAAWLAFPLTIVLVPEVALAIAGFVQRLVPDAVRIPDATRGFLYSIVAVIVAFAATITPISKADGRSGHPRLRGIRGEEVEMAALDGVLNALEAEVNPHDRILAYPNAEMLYFITDTRSPLGHMFTHESENVLLDLLEKSPPRVIVYRNQATHSFWKYSESRRELMEKFLSTHDYETIYSSDLYSIFRLPRAESKRSDSPSG